MTWVWILIFAVTRNIIMIQKPETRTDRLNKLSYSAKRDEPVSLENRARLESRADLRNQANQRVC
jgi:hypothetical protein